VCWLQEARASRCSVHSRANNGMLARDDKRADAGAHLADHDNMVSSHRIFVMAHHAQRGTVVFKRL